jgi:hypothetical protein
VKDQWLDCPQQRGSQVFVILAARSWNDALMIGSLRKTDELRNEASNKPQEITLTAVFR